MEAIRQEEAAEGKGWNEPTSNLTLEEISQQSFAFDESMRLAKKRQVIQYWRGQKVVPQTDTSIATSTRISDLERSIATLEKSESAKETEEDECVQLDRLALMIQRRSLELEKVPAIIRFNGFRRMETFNQLKQLDERHMCEMKNIRRRVINNRRDNGLSTKVDKAVIDSFLIKMKAQREKEQDFLFAKLADLYEYEEAHNLGLGLTVQDW